MQVDEAQTAEILEKKLKVRSGSLLYIQSTVPLRKMPRLCTKYRCFNRDSVWIERSDEVSTSHLCSTLRVPIVASARAQTEQITMLAYFVHQKHNVHALVVLACIQHQELFNTGHESSILVACSPALTHGYIVGCADSIQADISASVLHGITAGRAWYSHVRQHPLGLLWGAGQEVCRGSEARPSLESSMPHKQPMPLTSLQGFAFCMWAVYRCCHFHGRVGLHCQGARSRSRSLISSRFLSSAIFYSAADEGLLNTCQPDQFHHLTWLPVDTCAHSLQDTNCKSSLVDAFSFATLRPSADLWHSTDMCLAVTRQGLYQPLQHLACMQELC
jgi:hypothetical protein